MSAEEDRLARWSRLKSEASAPAEPEAIAVEAPAQLSAEEALAVLPPLEEIDAATDIRGFLHEAVPQALRAAALSRAWLADPAIRDRVPDAIDYAEDYNAPHSISGWGPACPDEARKVVARAHAPDPRVEAGPQDRAPQDAAPQRDEAASERDVCESQDDDGDPARAAPVAEIATTSIMSTHRRRHGGAMPLDD